MKPCDGHLRIGTIRPPTVNALLLCLLLPSAQAPCAEPAGASAASVAASTGSVEGIVVLAPSLDRRKMQFQLYPDPALKEPKVRAVATETDDTRNVLIYVQSVPSTARAVVDPGPDPVMRQVNETFVPHILPVLRGTTVEFPNADPIFHNVFSLSRAGTFDLGRYPKGDSRSARFDRPGVVRVFCHIHSDMSATIVVLDNPFFSIPDSAGHFRIAGLPPGEYKVAAWHERVRTITRSVRIEAGQTTTIEFNIPLPDPPAHD